MSLRRAPSEQPSAGAPPSEPNAERRQRFGLLLLVLAAAFSTVGTVGGQHRALSTAAASGATPRVPAHAAAADGSAVHASARRGGIRRRGHGRHTRGGVAAASRVAGAPKFGGDVDFVFTFVATPTADDIARRAAYCPNEEPGGVQRFRDLGTFRMALRSVLRYAPWVRHVHVVTNGRFPCWLGGDAAAAWGGRLRLVEHVDMWDAAHAESDLPTFASSSIIAYTHNVPGLSEHYVLLDDDMVLARHARGRARGGGGCRAEGNPRSSRQAREWLHACCQIAVAQPSIHPPSSELARCSPSACGRNARTRCPPPLPASPAPLDGPCEPRAMPFSSPQTSARQLLGLARHLACALVLATWHDTRFGTAVLPRSLPHRPVTKAMLFEPDGTPRLIFDTPPTRDPHWKRLKRPGQMQLGHMATVLRVSDVRELQARFPAYFRRAASVRCRSNIPKGKNRYAPRWAYNWWMVNALHANATEDRLRYAWGRARTYNNQLGKAKRQLVGVTSFFDRVRRYRPCRRAFSRLDNPRRRQLSLLCPPPS